MSLESRLTASLHRRILRVKLAVKASDLVTCSGVQTDMKAVDRALRFVPIIAALVLQGCASAPVPTEWTIPVGPASDNHTLDDCIRNSACSKKLSVGHRGTITWAPENTKAALDAALLMGADAVEMDVRSTRDGILILMHDATLDRTTNCRGQVAEKTWGEIKDCKVRPILPGIQSDKIPTFRDALAWLKGKTVIDVDVKNPILIGKVATEVRAANMQHQVMVLTETLEAAKILADNGIAVLALAKNANAVSAALALSPKPVAVEVDIQLLPLVQKQVHQAGSRVFVDALGGCDLVGAPCYQRLVRFGADLIQTDRLPELVPFLEKVNH